MKKRINDILVIAFFTINFVLLLSLSPKAYIDPSVMTYLIQAIAGVAIAIGAACGIYFRKFRKKINKKLNIDENRNKEVEDDNIEIKKAK